MASSLRPTRRNAYAIPETTTAPKKRSLRGFSFFSSLKRRMRRKWLCTRTQSQCMSATNARSRTVRHIRCTRITAGTSRSRYSILLHKAQRQEPSAELHRLQKRLVVNVYGTPTMDGLLIDGISDSVEIARCAVMTNSAFFQIHSQKQIKTYRNILRKLTSFPEPRMQLFERKPLSSPAGTLCSGI